MEVELTCRANKLFVKSIGHQRLGKAPLTKDSERKREGWGRWGGEWRAGVREEGQK